MLCSRSRTSVKMVQPRGTKLSKADPVVPNPQFERMHIWLSTVRILVDGSAQIAASTSAAIPVKSFLLPTLHKDNFLGKLGFRIDLKPRRCCPCAIARFTVQQSRNLHQQSLFPRRICGLYTLYKHVFCF